MQDEFNKNKNVTANSAQIETLKIHFPQCFDKDGRFLPHKLEEIVKADGADITREGYKLDWLGKSYARLLANLKTETLLAPNREHNTENANSENLLIQGDNLDVLKHLTNAYAEKIKMIYIDPPYNTGSDGFVYNDNRKFTIDELQKLAGVDEDEAKRILEFTNSNSNSHSAWLTFMYPRLYVARELLREDGVIFISIDDNEQAQLKLLCDEVFGEENFVSKITWLKKRKGSHLSKKKVSLTEYCFIYGTNSNITLYGGSANAEESQPLIKKTNNIGILKFPANIVKTKLSDGSYEAGDYGKGGSSVKLKNKFNVKNGVIANEFEIEGPFVWSQAYLDQQINSGAAIIINTNNLQARAFKSNSFDSFKGFSTLVNGVEIGGTNEDGFEQLKKLMNCEGLMDYPKPINYINEYVRAATYFNKEGIILDFFSGSGTTAHAVMALNAEDGGNRKHISVQLDEPTDPKKEARKAGYNTIFEITRERILRAAAKVKGDHPDAKCDFGFKEFKTIPANEGQFAGYLDDAETREDYSPFNGMAVDDDGITALLTTWKVYDGIPLHKDLQEVDLGGYTAYAGGDKLYFVDSGLNIDHITALLARIDDDPAFTPRKIVVFHHRFTDKQLREFSEAVNAPNRKHLQLEFINRF